MKSISIFLLFFSFITNYTFATNDSIQLRASFFEETIDSVCLGNSYNWRGNNYSLAGEYYDSLLTGGGEDSIYKLTLSVYAMMEYKTQIICPGDSAFLEGSWQYFAGLYHDTVIVAASCDSVIETELILENNSSFEHKSLCEGDSIFLAGAWQTESGMYIDHYTSQNGCDSIARTHISFSTGGDTTISKTICEGDSVYIGGDWYSTPGTYTFTEPSHINGCDSTTTIKIYVIDLPDMNVTATPQTLEEGKTSQLSIANYGDIIWSPEETLSCTDCYNPIASPLVSTMYYVTMDYDGCVRNDSIAIIIVEREFLVEIPEGFSPNGDGVNDLFKILFIEEYPDNTIIILNRWGNIIFEVAPYSNNWDGTNKLGGSIGEELPEGTYFYILKLDRSDDQILKGYIYLKR